MSAVAADSMRRPPKTKGAGFFGNVAVRAVISLAVFIAFWEIASRLKWPWIGQAPAPSVVLDAWIPLLTDKGYWYSWVQSSRRVLSGFIAAMIIGIPLGLAMATSRIFNDVTFPIFEILRPIPPLAWVPAAINFWPPQELSIGFVIFHGAIYTIMLNVDIPHPRDYGVLTSKRFRELIEETNDAVHEEALKAFQAGEKEG